MAKSLFAGIYPLPKVRGYVRLIKFVVIQGHSFCVSLWIDEFSNILDSLQIIEKEAVRIDICYKLSR